MKHIVLTAIIAVTGYLAASQSTVMPANQSVSNDGIFYSLPQTVLKIGVEVEKQSFYAGPLADYADDYLGLEDVRTSDEQHYRITAVTFATETIPDPDQFYFIEFSPDEMKDKHRFSFALSEAGMLTGFNKETFGKREEVKATTVMAGDRSTDKEKLFDYQVVKGVQQVIDTVIRQITVDTTTIQELQTSRQWVRKTRKEKAQEVVERLQQIMQDRYYLSIGYQEVAYDKGAIQFMDERLKERQQEYEALFTGKTVTEKQQYHFEYIPEKTKKAESAVLFKFSERSGIRDAGSTIGTPVNIRIENDEVTGNIEKKARALLQSNKKRRGIYYRVPGYAAVSLTMDDDVFYRQRFRINQLGVVSFAPYSRKMGFDLHPESGALRQVDYLFED